MRPKRRVWVWVGAIVAALVAVAIGFGAWSSIGSSQRHQAYLAEMQALPGVAHVQYEIQHPGVPWNNDLVVLAAIDFSEEAAAADLIMELVDISEAAELMDRYTTHIYLADSSSMSEYQYADRNKYFKSTWLPDGIRDRLGDGYEVFQSGVRLASN